MRGYTTSWRRTGEVGNPVTFSMRSKNMIRHGEKRRLLLSNTAIASYRQFRAEQALSLAS
jgi:hypothetical protein